MKDKIFIFLFFLSFLLFFAQGHNPSIDASLRFEMTKSIIDRGSFEVEHPFARKGVNERYYNTYGPIASFIGIPFYLIAKLTAHFTRFPMKGLEEFFFSMINPLLSAFIILIYFMFLKNALKLEPKRAFLCCILLCFTSSFLFYAKSTANEIPTTLFFLLGIYFLFKESKKTKDWILGGAFFGLAYLTRWEAALFSVPVFLWIIYLLYKKKEFSSLGFLIGFIPFLIAGMLYTYFFFGNFFFQYGEAMGVKEKIQIHDVSDFLKHLFSYPFLRGFYRRIFSLEQGLFSYNPFLLFSFFGLVHLRKRKEQFFLILSWLFLFIIFYSFVPVRGAWMGPRYFLPVIPFLTFLAINYDYRGITRWFFNVLIFISFVINFSSINVCCHRICYKEAIFYGNEIEKNLTIAEMRLPLTLEGAFEVWRNYLKYPNRDYFFSKENASFNERLEKQATVALPNFWWVFLPFFGVPRVLVYMVMVFLLFIGIYSGYKIRKEVLRENLTIP